MRIGRIPWGLVGGAIALGTLAPAPGVAAAVESDGSERLTVHFVASRDATKELVFDLDGPIEPPPGEQRYWLQGEWRMTPFTVVGSRPAERRTYADLPLVPAGRISLPPGARPRGLWLHLLYLARPAGELRGELFVRRRMDEVGEGVLMPAGRVVAGIWDEGDERYRSLSRPFEVRARAVVEAPLGAPGKGADLVAEVSWLPGESAEATAAKLWIKAGPARLEPDLVFAAAQRGYAFWYDLGIERGELRGEATTSFLRRSVVLRPRTISRVTAAMAAKAGLDAEVRLPPRLRDDTVTLRLRRVASNELLASQELTPAMRRRRFERLLPGTFDLVLETRLGTLTETVELAAGENRRLLVEPQWIELRGRVLAGDAPHPGTLTFVTGHVDAAEAVADAQGRYQVVLLRPATAVAIARLDAAEEPFVQHFQPAIAESGEHHFRLGEAPLVVHVVDARTGHGIGAASVSARNSRPREEPFSAATTDDASPVEADAQGWAVLPPLRTGSVEAWAWANGYLPAPTPVRTTLTKAEDEDDELERVLRIPLEPIGEVHPVQPWTGVSPTADPSPAPVDSPAPNPRMTATGVPAAGVEAFLFSNPTGDAIPFSTRAGNDGWVRIPRQLRGVLVFRYPGRGFWAQPWPFSDGLATVTVLPPPAEPPLRVRVTDARGQPVPGAMLAVSVNGQRFSGASLAILAGEPPLTDDGGFWSIEGLRAHANVEVLAWSSHPSAQRGAASGRLDSQALTIEYPWPDLVELTLAE